MDRADYQQDKMFTGLWPFSTSRLFDADFLRKHQLFFSDEVLWVEDVYHTAKCLMTAERVCYLPQFIGYLMSQGIDANDTAQTLYRLLYRGDHLRSCRQ